MASHSLDFLAYSTSACVALLPDEGTICATNVHAERLLSCKVGDAITTALPSLNLSRLRRKLTAGDIFQSTLEDLAPPLSDQTLLVRAHRIRVDTETYDLLQITDISIVMGKIDLFRSYAHLVENTQRTMEIRLSSFPEENREPVLASDLGGAITYRNPAFTQLIQELNLASESALLPETHEGLIADALTVPESFVSGESRVQERVFGWKYRSVLGGTLVHLYGTELTAMREAERARRQVQDQLARTERIASLGYLADGIAHDFNNILTAVIGCAQLSLDEQDDQEFVTENLEEILTASNRAKGIITQILAFSRVQDTDLKPVSIADVLRETLRLQRVSLPDGVELRHDLSAIAGDQSSVLGNADQFHQVFMNLLGNAVHAVEKAGGHVDVHASVRSAAKGEPEPRICIEIRDDGVGMKPDILPHIFDPYYTTRDQGQGSGLGLAVAHGIVTTYSGTIEVTSELGVGSTFSVLLPVERGTTDNAVRLESWQPTSRAPATRRVMVVDDEPPVARVIAMMLERIGHVVHIHHDPVEALTEMTRSGYDCLVTDQSMPGMTGIELTKACLQAHPKLQVIVCSGYGARLDEANVISAGAQALLWKPIDFKRLADLIAQGNEA